MTRPAADEPGRPSAVLVGVAGGSGAGKSTLVRGVVRHLGADATTVIHHDAYYRDLSHLPFDERVRVNFDHPDSLETELLVEHLGLLLLGETVEMPTYDFSTHTRRSECRKVSPKPVVIVDGILVLADSALRSLIDLAVYVHAESASRLERRLQRDTADRGRTSAAVVAQFERTVLPMHDAFVEPSRAHAHLEILGGGRAPGAVELVVDRIRALLSRSA